MNAMVHLLKWDLVVQVRSGFWLAGIVATLPWAILLLSLPKDHAEFVLPAILFLDISLTGTLFVAGVYFLERGEGVLNAFALTPIKTWRWLVSKVISLSLIGTVMGLSLMVVLGHLIGQWLLATVVLFLMNALFVLIGFLVAVPFDRFTNFILLNSILFAVLNLPSLVFFGINSNLYWCLPTQPALVLTRGIFQDLSLAEWVSAFGILCVWIGVGFQGSVLLFHRYVAPRKGG